MTHQPAPSADPGTPSSAAARPRNRLAGFLALGLLITALGVGGGVWLQAHRADAAYKGRAAAFHAALTKVRADLETGQPPDVASRDWDAARAREKEWEDHLSDADDAKDLTQHLRAASIMYGNIFLARQQPAAQANGAAAQANGTATTQPTTRATHDDQTVLTKGNLALDFAGRDLKK